MFSELREALIGLPGYRLLRFTYQSIFDRDAIRRRKRRREFFSTFLRPADLVFDVGANLGNYSEALCAIGATVVAIEPDPRNLKILRRRLRNREIHIEPCALGRKEGIAELHFAAARGDISTLSTQWVENSNVHWDGKVQVRVRTLDSIAQDYGIPKFVKIDAEGYDAEVLYGMSFRPFLVSFEFLPGNLNTARECIQLLREFTFNFVIEEESRFELKEWVNSEEMLSVLLALPATALYGDVFARNPLQAPVHHGP